MTVSEFGAYYKRMYMNTVESIEIHARIGSNLNIIVTIGNCIHYSWYLKFMGKAIQENNENWIPTNNKKYFTVIQNI